MYMCIMHIARIIHSYFAGGLVLESALLILIIAILQTSAAEPIKEIIFKDT